MNVMQICFSIDKNEMIKLQILAFFNRCTYVIYYE